MSSKASIVNVVGGGELGLQMRLNRLFNNLNVKELKYEPETSPMLHFKMDEDGPTIMLFSSGSYFLAGANSIEDAKEGYRNMLSELEQLGENINNPNFEIRNIVCRLDFKREFELSELSIAFGLEYCEYDPENSPGLFYRLPECEGVFQIFRTGIVLLTGVSSSKNLRKCVNILIRKFYDIKVDVDDEVINIMKAEIEASSEDLN